MKSYKGIAISQRETTIVSCKVSISYIILHHVRITLSHASFCRHPLHLCIKFHQVSSGVPCVNLNTSSPCFAFIQLKVVQNQNKEFASDCQTPWNWFLSMSSICHSRLLQILHWGLFSSIVSMAYHLNPTAATKLEQICTLNNPSNLPLVYNDNPILLENQFIPR